LKLFWMHETKSEKLGGKVKEHPERKTNMLTLKPFTKVELITKKLDFITSLIFIYIYTFNDKNMTLKVK